MGSAAIGVVRSRNVVHAALFLVVVLAGAAAQYLVLVAEFVAWVQVLFCIGVYGVLARRNAVLVLMSVELMLNAVNINLVAFSAFRTNVTGQIFALFIITIAAAEVGVGLAIVLLIYRNLRSPDLDEVD